MELLFFIIIIAVLSYSMYLGHKKTIQDATKQTDDDIVERLDRIEKLLNELNERI